MNRRVSTVLIGVLLSVIGSAVAGPTSTTSSSVRVATSTAVSSLRGGMVMDVVNVMDRSGISADVLTLAVSAVSCAVNSGAIEKPKTLSVIDYSKPSTEERLWVFDVATGSLLFKELVAHGRNTGENMATSFSDAMNSRQSSLGLFITGDTYVGSNGYSLRLDGLEPGFNANARERAIVMHGAPYVNTALAKQQGRIGRSWGCPALSEAIAHDVINTVRGGGVLFSYYPDDTWLTSSKFLHCANTKEAKDTKKAATPPIA